MYITHVVRVWRAKALYNTKFKNNTKSKKIIFNEENNTKFKKK